MTRGILITLIGAAVPVLGGLSAPADAAGQNAAKTIAVLDFVNRDAGDGHDWLGKGLADMVITDLSASDRLTVVDRRRVQQIVRELELGAAGIIDPQTAPRVGRIAKVQWLLFGTFLRRGDRVSIEALLMDVTTGRSLRIEQVEGPWGKLFELERALAATVLAKLDVPMTEKELRQVKRLKTESLPAFEHYARSLGLFDEGRWYDALCEARLARRADPGYLKAAVRVAELYHEVGEPEHAVVEYRRLVALDENDSLPDEAYFRMAVALEEATADRAAAGAVLKRLLRRYKELDKPFRVTDPFRPSRGWEDAGGKTDVDKIAEQYKIRLRTLACLSRWQLQAGEDFEAARLWSQIGLFLHTHGMPFGHQSLGVGLLGKNGLDYAPLYWRFVRENRDATLYPAFPLRLLEPDQTADADTEPTHGFYKWQHGQMWLAPPGQEIARVSYRAGEPGPPKTDGVKRRQVQFDFSSPEGYHSLLFKLLKVEPDGAWHELKLDPGIRAIKTYVHHTSRWQMRFDLRPWTKAAKVPEIGGLQVNLLPPGADVFFNGKFRARVNQGMAWLRIPAGRYEVEARWPDGRRQSATVDLAQGRREGLCLNADLATVSRRVLAREGSNTCLITDRGGRIWLVWDEVSSGDIMRLNKESDLYCATSGDGIQWSRPRRLPGSSLGCDMFPILRQDRRGVYWLLWISDRGEKAQKNLWMASSPNGVEWSFPRKIILPEEVNKDLPRWRESRLANLAFAVDRRDVFWLVWQGWLLRSDDAVKWQVDSVLRTSGQKYADNMVGGKHYQLSCDPEGRLLLVADERGGCVGANLWRRSPRGDWSSLARLTDETSIARHVGGAACRGDGTILAVTPHGSNLFVHELAGGGPKREPILVESYLSKPFHPSIAALPEGRFLLVFGSKEGLVAAVFRK